MNAELVPEGRLVAPISWATLGTHVVASPGSHGALEGGGLSVRSFLGENMQLKQHMNSGIAPRAPAVLSTNCKICIQIVDKKRVGLRACSAERCGTS